MTIFELAATASGVAIGWVIYVHREPVSAFFYRRANILKFRWQVRHVENYLWAHGLGEQTKGHDDQP